MSISEKQILRHLPFRCFYIDASGVVRYDNHSKATLGCPVETLFEYNPELYKAWVMESIKTKLSQQKITTSVPGRKRIRLGVEPVAGGAVFSMVDVNGSETVTGEDNLARFYTTALDSLDDYVYAFDRNGRFVYVNQAMRRLYGIDIDPIGKQLSELEYPEKLSVRLNAHIASVFASGKAVRDEVFFTSRTGFSAFFNFIYSPVLDANGKTALVVGVSRDTTALVQDISVLKNTINATFDSVKEMIQVFEAVRNDHGDIIDFTWILINQRAQERFGNVVGKRLLAHNPGVIEAGIFDHFVEVVNTGKPMDYEKRYRAEQFDGWYHQSAVKLGDGIATTTTDITARKQSEDEVVKNLTLLKASESLSMTGSWEYDRDTDLFYCSTGMYGLFKLPCDVSVSTAIFLQHALPSFVKQTKEFIRALKKSNTDLETLIEFEIDGQRRTHRIRVSFTDDAQPGKLRVIGVNMDVTTVFALENQNRMLIRQGYEDREKQQLDLLTSTFNAQEEERGRLAVKLHNDLAQSLYGLLLNLKSMMPKTGEVWSATHENARQFCVDILKDAITETRRISHQLTPSMLQQYGLQVSLEEMIRKFAPHFNIGFDFKGLQDKLQPYHEIFIYRTVQELLLNAVKHAEAKNISISIARAMERFVIEVRDDGKGFDNPNETKGIGLATIRAKLKLLGGSLELSSGKGKTVVRVLIPT